MMQQRNSTMRPAPRPTGARVHRSRAAQPPTARDARPTDSLVPAQMEIGALVRRCIAESERFYRGQPHDTSFAYELFRRALVERDELAWEHIYTHYGSLVESWVRRSGAFAGSGESSEEDEAPEEEVGSRHFTVFDISLMSVTASHGPAAAK